MTCAGEIDPIFFLFGDDLRGDVNCQTNGSWSADNLMLIHKEPLHYVNNGVWCAISATRVTQPIYFPTSSFHTDMLKHILAPF
jgi:hypothetical protein